MTTTNLILVTHQSNLRAVTESEALAALGDSLRSGPRTRIQFDERHLSEDIEGGHWRSADVWVRQSAAQLREAAEQGGTIHFFGMPEVPIAIGLGAHFGDEVNVRVHDQARSPNVDTSWAWPETGQTLDVTTEGLPREQVMQPGEAVLIVEISFSISSHVVDLTIGQETLAAVRIAPTRRDDIQPGNVRSEADVAAIRTAVREALAAIRQNRPLTERIQLFVAAPPSVCFAVGQELQLRNGIDVQTFRYRAADAEEAYRPALLLTSRGLSPAQTPLTEDDRHLALDLRDICAQALEDVKQQAAESATDARAAWYSRLEPAEALGLAAPFSTLKSLSQIVRAADSLNRDPRDEDYEFSKESRAWQLSDSLILGFFRAADADNDRMREIMRLFFYHEYLHDWQDLTKYTAQGVGNFANCLEAIDYMADTYGLVHQLDFAIRTRDSRCGTEDGQKAYLVDQIGLIIRSFWAFEDPAPEYQWQERRLRRYLNWYLRRVLVREADIRRAMVLLAKQPHIEIAGLRYRTGRGRHWVELNQVRRGSRLEIGVVLEDGRFAHRSSTTDMSIEEAMVAFAHHDREAIDRFFNALYEHNRLYEE